MSSDEYWNGDCELPKYYRKADRVKRERMNFELWLQGMYFYEALCDAAPLFQSFAKKGTKAHPYSDHPYALDKQDEENREEIEAKKTLEKGRTMMEMFMAATNKKMKEKAALEESPAK